MAIYVSRNGERSGPYEDSAVRDQLRSGQLLPGDMGIKEGDPAWRTLAEIFPDATPASTAPAAVQRDVVAEPTRSGGGCLKSGLITVGLILFFLGIAAAIGSRFIPSVSCDLAEEDHKRIEKLRSDLDKATKNGDDVKAIEFGLKQELSGAEAAQRNCNEDKFRNNSIGVGGGVAAAVGLLMSLIGLLVGRRK